MQSLHRFLAVVTILVALNLTANAQKAARDHAGTAPPAATTPASHERSLSLRKPGFLFLELGTVRIDEYVNFFRAVGGFELTHQESRYIQMKTELGELMFLHPDLLPSGHPFHKRLIGSDQGLGVEIGLVVADLNKAYAAAAPFREQGWKESSGIGLRPWGVRDFRILSPDGYYFRITEPPQNGNAG